MMNKKRLPASFLLLSIILSMIFMTGCSDYTDVSDRLIVLGMGFDYDAEKQNYKVTFQNLIFERVSSGSSGDQGDGKTVDVSMEEIEQAGQALNKIDRQQAKIPYLEHTQLFIIGEEAARNGIGPVIDNIFRSNRYRATSQILVTDGRAEDILRWQSNLSKVPMDFIQDLVTTQAVMKEKAVADSHRFMEFFSDQYIGSSTGVISIVEKSDGKKAINLDRMAIFKNDQLAGILDETETLGFLWATGNIRRRDIDILLNEEKKEGVLLRERSDIAKIIPKLEDGRIKMQIKITSETDMESYSSTLDIYNPETIKLIQQKQEEKIRNEIQTCIKKLQKGLKVDALRFSKAIHSKYPAKWKEMKKDWESIYPDLEVQVEVRVVLRGSGFIQNPIKPEED